MKNKQDLQNIDRSESESIYFGDIVMNLDESMIFSDNKITIKNIDPEYFVPEDVLFTWDSWQKVKNNTFSPHPTEDGKEALYFDDSDPIQESNFVNNLDNTSHWDGELKQYVKAYRFILNLLLRSGEIEFFDKLSSKRIAFDILKKSINNDSIWLEYYLLNNEKQIKKLNLIVPRKREYRPGKVAAKQYEYIKELSERAIKSEKSHTEERYLCNWLLTYSSPAQIWFGLQVNRIKEQWLEQTIPRIRKTKETIFKEQKALLDKMKEDYEKVQLELIEDENAEDLFFDRAFLLTQIRFEQLHGSNKHIEFVKAHQAKNNYIRKRGKSDGKGVQVLRTDEKGNLLMGNREIQFYDKATGEITYKKSK